MYLSQSIIASQSLHLIGAYPFSWYKQFMVMLDWLLPDLYNIFICHDFCIIWENKFILIVRIFM